MKKKLRKVMVLGLISTSLLSANYSHAAKLKILHQQPDRKSEGLQEFQMVDNRNFSLNVDISSKEDVEDDSLNSGLKVFNINKNRIKAGEQESKEDTGGSFLSKLFGFNKKENANSNKPIKTKQAKRKTAYPPINLNQSGVYISSYFGPRKSPIAGASSYHKGIDIAAPKGTFIMAVNDGIVSSVREAAGGSGNEIRIMHDDGTTSVYKHMSKRAVNQGQRVKAGDVIGTVGNTGLSTGPHLHFEIIKNGVKVNPLDIVRRSMF